MARQNPLHCYNSKMDHPALLPRNNGNGGQRNHDQTFTKQFLALTKDKESIPITQKFDPTSSINTAEIVSSNDILQATFRPSTILECKAYQTKWNNYCMQNNISHIQLKTSELLDFFNHLYSSGAFYSALKPSESALTHIAFLPPYSSILEHPQIIKYFKGVYNSRLPTQKLAFVWDV